MSDTLEAFEGVGKTLEQALAMAHSHIRPRPGRDFAISRVIDWGMQRGGFTDAVVLKLSLSPEKTHVTPLTEGFFYVRVVEDRFAPFKT